MKTHRLEQADWHASKQVLLAEEINDPLRAIGYVKNLIYNLFQDYPEYREYIRLWGKLKGLDKIGILDADGNYDNGWKYYDENGEHLVKKWVGAKDGKYAGLIIHVCNPGKELIIPKKSMLIIPDFDVEMLARTKNTPGNRATCFSLISPSGEIDPYKIDEEIDKLKEKLGER